MIQPLDVVPVGLEAAILRTVFALPDALRRSLAGPPVQVDGQELALDAQLLLKLQRLTGHTQLSADSADLARELMRNSLKILGDTPLPGLEVSDRRFETESGELAARLYRPQDLTGASTLMVYFHGGGWVIGDLDTHDDLCRFLAKHVGIRVLSVDYRLAPEHPFPAALDDAIAGYDYAVRHAGELGSDPHSIAVGGDSAGGNLAASVAYHAASLSLPQPQFELLFYPAVDATTRRRSRELFGNGYLLSDGDMEWFMTHYAPDADDRKDPRLSLLLADDLTGLPPSYVITAGFDPLRDEGEAFAERLRESGVPVVLRRFDDLIHGFASLRQAGGRFHEALCEVAGAVRVGLALWA